MSLANRGRKNTKSVAFEQETDIIVKRLLYVRPVLGNEEQ
jgi:hypothetical protein